MMEKPKTSIDLFKNIQTLVDTKKMDYIDAVVYYCSLMDIEVETIADVISKNQVLKEKIQIEAEQLNLLPKVARLPI